MAPPQSEQSQFANEIAAYLGYDPRVVFAWTQLETGGHTYGGFHNWLNLRPYPGDPYSGVSPGNFEEYASAKDAMIATKRRLSQPFAAPIRAAGGPGHTPEQEIAALALSAWDAGHYGGPGGPSIVSVFNSLYPGAKLSGPASSHVVSGGGTQTQSSALDKLTGVPGSGGISGLVGDTFSGVESALLRGVFILAGVAISLVALYIIVRALGVSAPTLPGPLGRVASAAAPSAPRKGDAAAGRGEPVTRTGAPEPVTRADRKALRKNDRMRQREAAGAARQRDADAGGVPY